MGNSLPCVELATSRQISRETSPQLCRFLLRRTIADIYAIRIGIMKRVGDWGRFGGRGAFGGIVDPVAVSPKAAAFTDCGGRKATLTGNHKKPGRYRKGSHAPKTRPFYRPRIKHMRPDYGPKLNDLFTLPFAKYFRAAGTAPPIFVAGAEKGALNVPVDRRPACEYIGLHLSADRYNADNVFNGARGYESENDVDRCADGATQQD